MKNATNFEKAIRINTEKRAIEVTKNFNNASHRYGTEEYKALQNVRRDYPEFPVVVKTARTKVDHLKGLTYKFMEKYIASHDDAEARMAIFNDLRGKSDDALDFGMEALTYGQVKVWFLKTYPEIEAFQKRRESALAA